MSSTRTWIWVLVAGSLVGSNAWSADKKPEKTSYLSATEAGPDFAVQGEYAMKAGDHAVGVQVIAYGDGVFEGVVWPGGLPGDGGDASKKVALKGATEGSVVKLTGQNITATIENGVMTLEHGLHKGTLKKVERESPTMGAKPPAGAIVLFDGSSVDAWQPGKMEADHLMGVGTRTKEKFDSFTLHLEFRTPFMPYAKGQARGNSGMYLQDQYECQILDSFGLEGLDNECGGIYQNARPSINMCFPPLAWQTYDVEFTGAKFDAAGNATAKARCTIRHNGVVIHDDLELATTPGGGQRDQKPGALYLQDHGDPVRFRNIWIVKK